MAPICYINGRVVEGEGAAISVMDLGLQRGYAVFDYLRTCNGKLFHAYDHLVRFRNSAAELHLRVPLSDEEIVDIAGQLIARGRFSRPGIRLLLTGGNGNDTIEFDRPNFVIIAEELPSYPPGVYKHGVKLITVEYQRELPTVKTTNYMNAIRLEPLRRAKNAFDILYYFNNKVTECPRNNFFIFTGNTLATARDHVLAGVTRKLILEFAQPHFEVSLRDISPAELPAASEAFVASTTKGIIPVVQIDDDWIGTGRVGNRTRKLMQLFEDYLHAY